MKAKILYKIHENEECDILQSIVRYLYAATVTDIRPTSIIERNFPLNINVLPTIVFVNGTVLEGLDKIIKYYELVTGVSNLKEKAITFNELNPDYRINDNSTHKKVII